MTHAADAISPAVVTITTQLGQTTDPFSLPSTGVGRGFVFDANGWILTNHHVVADATHVSVQVADGRQLDGTVYGIDTLTDLAIVKVDATDLPVGRQSATPWIAQARPIVGGHRQSARHVHQQRHLGRHLGSPAGGLVGERPGAPCQQERLHNLDTDRRGDQPAHRAAGWSMPTPR